MSGRLWDKGEPLDEAMHRLTVGDDPVVDRHLVPFDCIGSAAHARMLAKIGVLTEKECESLLAALREIAATGLEIPPELEDVHTAIEARLTEKVGDAGRKIHTGRSRNDQVALAMRLYTRDRAVRWLGGLAELCDALLRRYDEAGEVPMPGYTHLQPAMPSTVGAWLHAFLEGCLELMREGLAVLDLMDANPLGSGAGFGVPLPVDRSFTASLLGFSRVQRSPLDVQNSRGRHEARLLAWGSAIGGLLEKLAWDVQLFSTREFGFFSLPAELATGSSIMPQKRNPDLVELLRAGAGRVRGAAAELAWVSAKLPSSYHRDLQYTKAPLLRGVAAVDTMLEMAVLVVGGIQVNAERLREAMYPDLYATHAAYRLAREGVPFRDAYRQVAEQGGEFDPSEFAAEARLLSERTSADVAAAREELSALKQQTAAWAERLQQAETACLGVGE
jgi:argininosuccinate lyase